MAATRLFIYRLLDQKKIGWLIIAIAAVCKSILVACFSNYEADKSFYLLLAKNISAGEGFTIPVNLLNNPGITENIYLPAASSPLYSIIAAPLLKLFPGNYFLVTWLIESLSWLLLLVVLRKLLLRLTQNHYWTNLFILFTGAFIYTAETSSSAKDMLAVALLFVSLYHCIKIVNPETRTSFIYLLATAFLFLLPGFTKLTYKPLALAFPLAVLFIGLLKKEKTLLRKGVVLFLITAVLFALQHFYFQSLEKQAVARHSDYFLNRWTLAKSGDDFVAGFFPENLQYMHPFIPSAVANLDVLGVQVKTFLPAVYHPYAALVFSLHCIGLAVMLFAFFYLARRYYRKYIPDKISFLLTGLSVSLLLVFLLSLMSLRYQALEYKGTNYLWTFVYESRAFLFPVIFLQLCLFAFLFAKEQASVFLKTIRIVLLIIVSISFLHGLYFRAKKATELLKPEQKPASVYKLVTNEADSIGKTNPGHTVWLATETTHLDWYAKLHQQKVMNNLSVLRDSSFRLLPKIILLTAVAKEDTSRLRDYLQRKDVKLFQNYDNTFFVFRQDGNE